MTKRTIVSRFVIRVAYPGPSWLSFQSSLDNGFFGGHGKNPEVRRM
jgi:hypothetical protein